MLKQIYIYSYVYICTCMHVYEYAFLCAYMHICILNIQKNILIKSPKQRLETYCFCSVSYSYFYFYYYYSYSFFPRSMNLSTADLRNYRTEFHETWWIYRYMYLVDPKVFRFVVKGVKTIFLGVQRGWGLL
jgi:hypothetical protein